MSSTMPGVCSECSPVCLCFSYYEAFHSPAVVQTRLLTETQSLGVLMQCSVANYLLDTLRRVSTLHECVCGCSWRQNEYQQ